MFKKQILRIFALFILAFSILLCSVTTPPVVTKAKTTNQMKNELSELEEKSKQLDKEIAALKKDKADKEKIRAKIQERIDNTQDEINTCNRMISDLKAEIADLEAQIAKKEGEIEDTKFLFRQRMRSIYMTGSTNNELLILLNSDNFADFLALSEVSKTIEAHDKKMIQEITAAITEIDAAKAIIETKINEQNGIKVTLDAKKADLRAQRSEINGVISEMNSDQASLEKKAKEYDKAIEKLEDEIQKALAAANNSGSNPVFVSGTFIWPVPGYYNITSYYGYRIHPISGKRKLHGGIDIASAGIAGKPIVAAADGVVIAAGWNSGGFGNWVMINHGTNNGNQFATLYAHMKYTPVVSNGQNVKAGQVLGYVGTTGASTGNHLHFEVRINGNRTDPMNYFKRA